MTNTEIVAQMAREAVASKRTADPKNAAPRPKANNPRLRDSTSLVDEFPYWSAVLDGSHEERPHRMNFSDLMRFQFPPLTWTVQDLVSGVGITILGGPKKQGKSWLALDMAISIACGGKVLDKQAVKGSVVFWVLEDGLALVQDRLRKMLPTLPPELLIDFDELLPPLNTDEGKELICREMARDDKPAAIFIDTLAAAKSGKADENDASQMGQLMNDLRRASMFYGVPVVLVAHHGKSTSADAGFALRGSSAIAGASHVNLSLMKGGWLGAEGKQTEKFRWGVVWDQDSWRWKRTYIGDARGEDAEQLPEATRSAPARSKAEAWILDYLRNHTETAGLQTQAILKAAQASGIDRSAYYRARKSLLDSGEVRECPHAGTLEIDE